MNVISLRMSSKDRDRDPHAVTKHCGTAQRRPPAARAGPESGPATCQWTRSLEREPGTVTLRLLSVVVY
eukprot:83963-Rhodomonas_salina.1